MNPTDFLSMRAPVFKFIGLNAYAFPKDYIAVNEICKEII
jgi:hypothetical protein